MINILLSSQKGLMLAQNFKILQKFLNKDKKVFILGYSFFEKYIKNINDWNSFYEKTKYLDELYTFLNSFNISNDNIFLANYFTTTNEEFINKLNDADILFIPGGAPEKIIERLHSKGLFQSIKDFSKIIIGTSAGAMIQTNIFHISKDRDYAKYDVFEGLHFFDFLGIEVHFNRKRKQKRGLSAAKFLHPLTATIPEYGMIIYNHLERELNFYSGANIYYFGIKRNIQLSVDSIKFI